jgi:hypothetical protein
MNKLVRQITETRADGPAVVLERISTAIPGTASKYTAIHQYVRTRAPIGLLVSAEK